MCAVGKLHATDENSLQHSHFTELNSHLDNSLNVVVTKYSSSESIMCTNQIILKCNNSSKWPKPNRIAFHNFVDEWLRRREIREKTQKCLNWEKIDRCINGARRRNSNSIKGIVCVIEYGVDNDDDDDDGIERPNRLQHTELDSISLLVQLNRRVYLCRE